MAPYSIRVYGDPVLRQVAPPVDEIDGRVAKLARDMLDTMYAAPGVGLAATQVGVRKRLFVYDIDEDPHVLVNPVVREVSGEWVYEEGCLSVPGMSWLITRPREVHVTGYDIEGNEVSIEADDLLARLVQHEIDHLDGVLLVERLDEDQRKDAMRVLRTRALDLSSAARAGSPGAGSPGAGSSSPPVAEGT